nr:hypothetical protein [Moorella glycerini]
MLKDALREMILAYRQQKKEIPPGGALLEQVPVELISPWPYMLALTTCAACFVKSWPSVLWIISWKSALITPKGCWKILIYLKVSEVASRGSITRKRGELITSSKLSEKR